MVAIRHELVNNLVKQLLLAIVLVIEARVAKDVADGLLVQVRLEGLVVETAKDVHSRLVGAGLTLGKVPPQVLDEDLSGDDVLESGGVVVVRVAFPPDGTGHACVCVVLEEDDVEEAAARPQLEEDLLHDVDGVNQLEGIVWGGGQ